VSTAVLLIRFTAPGLLVLLALAALIAVAARRAGTDRAVESAGQVARVTAKGVVEPRLSPALLSGDRAARDEFDTAMHRYVLQGSLVRVKLWDEHGRVVYSDEPRLVGGRFPLGPDEQLALREQGSDSEVSDLSAAENRFEVPHRKLLESYVGVRATDGRPMLFEAYFRYDAVSEAGAQAWRTFAPPSLGALLVLQLVQIPLAWSLARRVQRQQQERERLLRHAVDSSEVERRRIAGQLHDGVVQELSGTAYALDAARLGGADDAARLEVITAGAAQLRHSIGALRSLLVDIYPPNLAEEGLPAALADLAAGLERTGMTVTLAATGTENLPPTTAAILFRVAQESLRNVAAHSGARRVEITAARTGTRATLVIDDDGRGFDGEELGDRFTAGHLGLRSLGDLLADAGGTLSVRSAPGQGTRVEVALATGGPEVRY
jgi:signal transduction histidine kinase